MPAPEHPLPPEDEDDPERARRLRSFGTFAQAGGAVFLVVAILGLVPAVLGEWSPGLARPATIAVLLLAPAIPVALLVVAALKLRR